MEKKKITGVIAPEHFKRHHDHENEMKAEEKALITQTMSHCHAFSKNFKGSAKGDWVDSAMSELDKISNNLKEYYGLMNLEAYQSDALFTMCIFVKV